MSLVLPWKGYYTMFVAVCYYIYNHHMFAYIDYLTGKKLPKWKRSVVTFIINYEVFMLISQLRFYLIINWTIFAVFLVLEIALLYRVPWTMRNPGGYDWTGIQFYYKVGNCPACKSVSGGL